MSAEEAATTLGVSMATLYAYVSRGMIRSFPAGERKRTKKYVTADVLRLVEKKEFRKSPAKAAAKGLHWGEPVLESELTAIHDGRLFFRGQDALELAGTVTLEEVASLLWVGNTTSELNLFADPARVPALKVEPILRGVRELGVIERWQATLATIAREDDAALDLRPGSVAKTGAWILRLMMSALCGHLVPTSIDGAIKKIWPELTENKREALRAAMIICADHELNISTFVARCIASARATPYEVVIGALAAFCGRRHGTSAEQVEKLLHKAGDTQNEYEPLAEHLRLHGYIPGFGHALYPDGDPRATLLISIATQVGNPPVVEMATKFMENGQKLTGDAPNLDLGLVIFCAALALPAGTSTALFALGREIGWIAHAIEQYSDPQLIRPRAHYVGLDCEA